MTDKRLSLALALLGGLLIVSVGHQLQEYGAGAIGATVLQGIDAGARNQLYLGGLLLSFAVIRSIPGLARYSISAPVSGSAASLWQGLLLANIALYLVLGEPVFGQAVLQLMLLALLVRWYPDQFLPAAIVSYQLLMFAAVFLVPTLLSPSLRLLLFPLLYLGLAHCLRRRRLLLSNRGNALLLVLVALPLLGVVIRELAYSAQLAAGTGVLQFILLTALAALCYRLTLVGSLTVKGFTQRWLFPLLVVSSVVLLEYQLARPMYGDFDYFHTGESVLPVQQLLQFGKLPFLDYQPAHGLFDMFPQLLYVTINPDSSSAVEMLNWGEGYMNGWLPRGLAALILYLFLARFFAPLPALGLMLFLPGYQLVHPYYSFLLLPALWLLRNRDRPEAMGFWLKLFLISLLLGLWRVDFGIAALLASLVLFVFKFQEVGTVMIAPAAKGFGAVVSFALLGLLILTASEARDAWQLLVQLYQYIAIQTAAVSYGAITHGWNLTATLQYLLLPLVGVVQLALLWNTQRRDKYAYVLVLLSVISLVMATRSLHRHSLYVGAFNPYLFGFLLLALFSCCRREHKQGPGRFQFLPLAVALLYVLFPARSDIYKKVYYDYGIEKEYSALLSDSLSRDLAFGVGQGKRGQGPDRHLPLVARIDSLLQPGQTFYDFSNSSLLYPLSERELPLHMAEAVYQTSAPVQQYAIANLEQFRQQGRLPLVIFKQGTFWDAVDGVDNEVRSPLMAEYVYQHYQPCWREGRYQLWWQLSEHVCDAHYAAEFEQHLALGLLPWLQAQSPSHDVGAATYLELEVASPRGQQLLVKVGNSSLAFTARAGQLPQRYLLRLSLLHAWWLQGASYEVVSGDAVIVSERLMAAP